MDPNDLVSYFQYCISTAHANSSKHSYKTARKIHCWNQSLDELKKRVHQTRNSFLKTLDPEFRNRKREYYKKALKDYKTEIIRARNKAWRDFCTNATRNSPWVEPYYVFSKKKCNPPFNIQKEDRTSPIDLNDTIHHLLNTHFPDDTQDTDDPIQNSIHSSSFTPPSTRDDIPFTFQEVKNAIFSLKNKKAPGVDGITPEMIKATFNSVPIAFIVTFNLCLNKGIFPDSWKIISIKPKTNTQNYASDFRPVSLLPVIRKILDYLLINRINHHLFKNKILHTNQFGFLPGASTNHALHNALNFVYKAWEENNHALLTSVDIKGAFDNMWWPASYAISKFTTVQGMFLSRFGPTSATAQQEFFSPITVLLRALIRVAPGIQIWSKSLEHPL